MTDRSVFNKPYLPTKAIIPVWQFSLLTSLVGFGVPAWMKLITTAVFGITASPPRPRSRGIRASHTRVLSDGLVLTLLPDHCRPAPNSGSEP